MHSVSISVGFIGKPCQRTQTPVSGKTIYFPSPAGCHSPTSNAVKSIIMYPSHTQFCLQCMFSQKHFSKRTTNANKWPNGLIIIVCTASKWLQQKKIYCILSSRVDIKLDTENLLAICSKNKILIQKKIMVN